MFPPSGRAWCLTYRQQNLEGGASDRFRSVALPVAVFEQLQQLTGVTPLERYGMTETMITISTRIDGDRRPGHVGLPLNGVETRLRGDDGELLNCDVESIGTLEVRAQPLALAISIAPMRPLSQPRPMGGL